MLDIMKMSKYNLTTYDNEGNLILYNFLKGLPSITKVMKSDVNKFTQLFLKDEEIHKASCEDYVETIDVLLKSGILVASDTNENVLYDSKYYEEAYDSRLVLMIFPTGDCNFSCTYCFQAEKPLSRDAMTADGQKAIIKFVQRQIPSHKALHVIWFGGEPLLETQIIKHLSEKFIKICNARFLPYSSNMISNGFFLDADIFDMLYNLKIYDFMITVDGFKEQHDKIKFTHNGMGTYDVVMGNLLRIRNSKQYKFARIKIRINVTKSFFDILDDFILYLESSFSDDPRFSFYFAPAMNYSSHACPNDDVFVDGKEMLTRLYRNEVYINKLLHEEDKIRLIEPGNMCIANLKNFYAITPDLNVYKCYDHYDMDINNVGHINSNGDLLLNEALHQRWFLINKLVQKIPEACNDCFYLLVCHYGSKVCPVRYLKTTPDARTCPMKDEEHNNKLNETILYAAHNYPCTILSL